MAIQTAENTFPNVKHVENHVNTKGLRNIAFPFVVFVNKFSSGQARGLEQSLRNLARESDFNQTITVHNSGTVTPVEITISTNSEGV